jgi:cysteine synthase
VSVGDVTTRAWKEKSVDTGVKTVRLPDARTGTPLRSIRVWRAGTARRLWLKLESHNPTGSVKFRTAVGLLEALDREQTIRPGTTLVESTSGNLGLALAWLATALDCKFIAVVDRKVPPQTRTLMEDAGAQLVTVNERDEFGGYLLTRLSAVRELCAADPSVRWTNQYGNWASPWIHRDTTAAELVHQTRGRLDAVLVAVSTGGTLTGISERLHRCAPATRIVAVDVVGSIVTSDTPRPHLLTGVGATRKSSFLRPRHYDQVLRATDVAAFAYCRMLEMDTGLALGGSSGAVLAAFTGAMTAELGAVRYPVAVCPDGADNYRSTFYDDRWLSSRGVLDEVRAAITGARTDGVAFEWEGDSVDVLG